MALSDNMRNRRIKLNMTMDELASKVGITRQMIDRYERNLAKPQPEVFVGIAAALGTTAEKLVKGD